VIFCAGEIVNNVVISITHKRSGIEGQNMGNSNVRKAVPSQCRNLTGNKNPDNLER
jgi:hypothetical protein